MHYQPDPRLSNPDAMKAEADRRKELAGRTLGSDLISTIVALGWALIVGAFKLLRLLVLYVLVRPLGGVLSRRTGQKRGEPSAAADDTATQIRARQSKR